MMTMKRILVCAAAMCCAAIIAFPLGEIPLRLRGGLSDAMVDTAVAV